MINLIAKRYYIENGPEMEDGELRKVIKSTLHSPVDRATEDDMYSKVMAAFVVVRIGNVHDILVKLL